MFQMEVPKVVSPTPEKFAFCSSFSNANSDMRTEMLQVEGKTA